MKKNKYIVNVKKHWNQINRTDTQILNVKEHIKQIEHIKQSNIKC